MTAKFSVYVTRDISEHDTFEQAFKAFFEEIDKMLTRGALSVQHLETACWIEGRFEAGGEKLKCPVYFYDARDFAYDHFVLISKDGKAVIADPLTAVPVEDVILLFAKSGLEQLVNMSKL
ncbi:MAG: hypothetical protein KBC81_02615 [Candidatus Pacebacteria bacterium]|nr:hypothetical protein [Candidatus Paceibacterota bacterium]